MKVYRKQWNTPALMKSWKILLTVWLLTLPLAARPDWVRRQGTRLVQASSGQVVRLRGMCLGNWWVPEGYMFGFEKATSPTQIERVVLELLGPQESRRFWSEYRERYVTRQDLQALARAGFNAVRVPLHFKFLRDPVELARLDWLIRECSELDLWVLPDLHAAPGGQTGDNIDDGASYPWLFESEEDLQLTAELWRELALRYRDEPTVLGYELLNEPIPNWPGYTSLHPELNKAYQRLGRAIREVDRRHLILLDGAEWATQFAALDSRWDDQLCLAFHRYWADPSPKGIQSYLELQKQRGVPILMTESGENSREWLREFRTTLEEAGLSWFFWPYKKMKTDSCVALIATPADWDKIVAYADSLGMEGEKRRQIRPSRTEARAAFATLLDNIQASRCQFQQGYLGALGLGITE